MAYTGTSEVVPVSNTEATLVFDTNGEIWGFTVQNIDAANPVYVSQDRLQLNSTQGTSGGATIPNVGIQIAANGGSWTVMFFNGRLFAMARTAPVGLRLEVWPIMDPRILGQLMTEMKRVKS